MAKRRWSWKTYSWNPDIDRYGKERIPVWAIWLFGTIAAIGIAGVAYALVSGSRTGLDRSGLRHQARHPVAMANDATASKPCRQTSEGNYDCTRWEEINLEKYAKETIITGYMSVPWETDEEPCVSADGSDICALLGRGVNTCASNQHRFGTRLIIPGLGECVVRDRLARKYSDRVDWYFGGADKVQETRQWGKRLMPVIAMQNL